MSDNEKWALGATIKLSTAGVWLKAAMIAVLLFIWRFVLEMLKVMTFIAMCAVCIFILWAAADALGVDHVVQQWYHSLVHFFQH